MENEKLVEVVRTASIESKRLPVIERYKAIAQAIASAGYVHLSQEEREALVNYHLACDAYNKKLPLNITWSQDAIAGVGARLASPAEKPQEVCGKLVTNPLNREEFGKYCNKKLNHEGKC